MKKLGILVSTDRHLDHLIGLVRAARDKEIEVSIFFTNRGVFLTRESRFSELEGLARMSLCKVSFEKFGLDKSRGIPGITVKDFAAQSRHTDLIESSDRYICL